MKKIKERAKKYEVTVVPNGKYFKAKLSVNFVGSHRLEGGGKSEELAVLNLINKLEEYIDNLYCSGKLRTKIGDVFRQRFQKSVLELNLNSLEITGKICQIIDKINQMNMAIENGIVYSQNSNLISKVITIENNATEEVSEECKKTEKCIISDYAIDWLKYKFSLCEQNTDNRRTNSRKTIDGYRNLLLDIALPYFNKCKKLYLTEISERTIKDLFLTQKSIAVRRELCIMLKVFFNDAVRDGKINESPLVNMKTPSKSKRSDDERDDYIDSDEQYKYLDAFEMENSNMSILFETMVLTGIRPEEACRA